jgi:23S rRNA pseudouridine1911/1915/1917 synthase
MGKTGWKKQKIIFIIVIAAIVAADQITKYIAKTVLPAEPGMTVGFIDGFMRFTYIENTGAAFSFFAGATWLLAVISAVMAVVVIIFLFKTKDIDSWLCKLALCFIAGGAIGNLIDRLAMGYVVDMLEFEFVNFAVFNVADCFVTFGAVMLCIFIIWFWEKSRKRKMCRKIELKVDKDADVRLDAYIAGQLGQYTRSFIKKLADGGRISLNGKIPKAGTKPRAGDVITVDIPETRPGPAQPEDIPLEIIYEDDDVAVVNKPQGMVTHPAAGNEDGTLVNAALFHIKDLSGIGGDMRPGIVHRLDKDTSGLIAIAKNDKAHTALSTQLSERMVKKKYIALCHGNVKADSGTVITNIGRHPRDAKKWRLQLPDARRSPTIMSWNGLGDSHWWSLISRQGVRTRYASTQSIWGTLWWATRFIRS